MDQRLLRLCAVLVVVLLLALTAFTLMLREGRRHQAELRAKRASGTGSRLVRPAGAPALPDYVREHMEKQGIANETTPVATSVVVEGAGQVDTGGTAVP
jgi:hypothetical protein